MEQQNGKANLQIEDSSYISLRVYITDIFYGLTVECLRALVSGSGEEVEMNVKDRMRRTNQCSRDSVRTSLQRD